MGTTTNVASIESVLRRAGTPLRATDIARDLGVPKSTVNALLYEHLDTVFSKNTADFTWTRAAHDHRRAASVMHPETHIRVEVYFAPQDDPIGELCKRIDDARTSVLVQAYYLRSEPIQVAMIRAKQRRVLMRVLLGCTSMHSTSSRDPVIRHGGSRHRVPVSLSAAGIDVFAYWGETNNHNKCMVIDGRVTVTGGLNFCDYAAENADNIVVIYDVGVAELFTRDWEKNFRFAQPLDEC